MYIRYITYLIFIEFFLRIVGLIVFPISWIFRNKLSKDSKCVGKFLWWFLHRNPFGDQHFQHKVGSPNGKWFNDFKIAYKWAARNPMDNLYYSRLIIGDRTDFKGYETCQKKPIHWHWRTMQTKDENDIKRYKHGKYLDYEAAILGKQKLKFKINNKRYFKISKCWPYYIKWLNLFIIQEYKFGFEHHNWAIQCPIHIRKADSKMITEYKEFMKNKQMTITEYK